MIEKVSLRASLSRFETVWDPKIVAALNGQHVKLVKLKGEFVWHRHDEADELFLVLRGTMAMQLRHRVIEVEEGELVVVPRGIEHCPRSDEEVHVLLFEPAGTVNTGDAGGDRTVAEPERL